MDVYALKLVTGEELVTRADFHATLCEGDAPQANVFTLFKPFAMQIQQVSPGNFGLSFVPWSLSNPQIESVSINKMHVVAIYRPSAEVEKQYLQQTSGIQLI